MPRILKLNANLLKVQSCNPNKKHIGSIDAFGQEVVGTVEMHGLKKACNTWQVQMAF